MTGVVLAGCSTNLGGTSNPSASATGPQLTASSTSRSVSPVKIGVLLPLGGFDQSAAVAKSLKQAAEMALFERDDPNVQLIVKDDGGTSSGAQAAATHAISDGADIIVGPLFAGAVPGAALVARQANVPVLALSNDQKVAGPGVYLMSFLVEQEIDRVVSFAAKRGKRQFAALIPDNRYGQIVETAFRQSVTRYGGALRVVERYPTRPNGMLKPTKRVMDAVKRAATAGLPIDALFVPGGQDTLPSLGPILAYQGFSNHNIQLLGTGAWDYPEIGRQDIFHGGWYAGPNPASWRNFAERFTRTFGHTPPRIASLAFDAVNYAIALAAQSAGGQPFAAHNITRMNGYVGVDGLVRFFPSGLSERSLAVLEVQKFGATVIDAAPSAAQPQTVSAVYN